MNILVISSAPVLKKDGTYMAYSPYVREMDFWFKYFEGVVIVCPSQYDKPLLKSSFKRQDIRLVSVNPISIDRFLSGLKAIVYTPKILVTIFFEMLSADHIHLRCPGNMGLLGALVQIFFPHKPKTAKYAGNWKPGARQPWSYRFQKWILSNTYLTKNMQVLVYGEWLNQTPNVKAFFTASHSEKDKVEIPKRKYDLPLRFLFVGSLSPGKQPVYALALVAELIKRGFPSELHVYGEGPEREKLNETAKELGMERQLFLHGNQPSEAVKEAYAKSHFLILPSKSEGWPKVVAEAMWWGVIPIATPVSCVPWMLDSGKRGVLLQVDLDSDVQKVQEHLLDKAKLKIMAAEAATWSRNYTLERFDAEIKKLL
tara:strand:+ start:2692 stop:3801 length:1110 start_codon:yes stop_codon:yes gene_type:complete